jgi:hypothetical protein
MTGAWIPPPKAPDRKASRRRRRFSPAAGAGRAARGISASASVRPRRLSRTVLPHMKGPALRRPFTQVSSGEVQQLGCHRRHRQGQQQSADAVSLGGVFVANGRLQSDEPRCSQLDPNGQGEHRLAVPGVDCQLRLNRGLVLDGRKDEDGRPVPTAAVATDARLPLPTGAVLWEQAGPSRPIQGARRDRWDRDKSLRLELVLAEIPRSAPQCRTSGRPGPRQSRTRLPPAARRCTMSPPLLSAAPASSMCPLPKQPGFHQARCRLAVGWLVLAGTYIGWLLADQLPFPRSFTAKV